MMAKFCLINHGCPKQSQHQASSPGALPGLNWYEVLLSPASSWQQPGATVAFGMLVQPYLVTAGFILVLCLVAAVYCGWLLYKTLCLAARAAAGVEEGKAKSEECKFAHFCW